MRILIVDDSAAHRKTAKQQLKTHDLTIVGTYEEAERLLKETSLEKNPKFDAMLTDLMLPGPGGAAGGTKFVGEEMPIGTLLALIAIFHGVQYIGILTDTNHHDHPASSCLDFFSVSAFYYKERVAPKLGKIGESTICLTKRRFVRHDVVKKNWGEFLEFIINGQNELKKFRED